MSMDENSYPKTRKHEDVAVQLRRFIAERHLRLGARLPSETQLAGALSASRPTLRAGLRILNAMGEIETRLGSGSYVCGSRKPVSIEIADAPGPMEILRARLLIEPRVAGEAALLADSSDIQTIQQVLSEMRNTKDLAWYTTLYRAFHLAVAAAANQLTIADLIGGLIEETKFRFPRSLFPVDDVPDHERIFEALQVRNQQAAVSAMRNHLLRTQERLFEEQFAPVPYNSGKDGQNEDMRVEAFSKLPQESTPRRENAQNFI